MNMRFQSNGDAVRPDAPSTDRTGFSCSPDVLPGLIRVLDLAMLATGGLVAALIVQDQLSIAFKFTCVFAVGFCHLVVGDRARLFSLEAIMRPMHRADDLIITVITCLLLFLSLAFALDAAGQFSARWLFLFVLTASALIVTGRLCMERLLRGLSARGSIGNSIVILGVGEQARRFLRRHRESNPYFTEIVGVFDPSATSAMHPPTPERFEGHAVLGDIDALLKAARARQIDEVVIAMPWNADQRVMEAVERLKDLPVNVFLSSDLIGFDLSFKPAVGRSTGLPLFEVVQRPISGWSSALKAVEDYVLALLILLLVAPLLVVIAIAVKLDSPGPILFQQARLGFNNREFMIYKFRSMYHSAMPETAVRQATKRDPRVTRVGRILRSTSLDELPQLLNVLNGTMSLVGPRPHAISHNEEYGQRIRGYFARHKVKPGITGWAQVNGLRGETDTLAKMEARIQHDVYYADNWSIFFDLKILIMTFVKVLFQKSAY